MAHDGTDARLPLLTWITRAVTALVLVCAIAPACAVPRTSPGEPPPNILFVMIDDLGWMDIHPQGNDRFTTPNLDRFAAQATRFTDYYAAAPVCSPTRAACITGLAPARLHVTNHIPDRWSFYDAPAPAGTPADEREGRIWGPARSRNELGQEQRTIAERLRAAGYRTVFVGKWHLAGADWRTTDTSLFPESHGFDVNIAGNAMGGPGTYFGPFDMPNYRKGEAGDYLPDLLAQEAIEQIAAARDAGEPLFLCLWTYTVHYPIDAPAELYAHYHDGADEPDLPTRYRAMVEGMDRAVGRVLRALDELDLASNTLVVFTSDNGQMPGASVATPLRGAKGHLHEGGIRVPMMIRWPGHVRAGTVESTPAIAMDFAPTFLAAAGVPYDPAEFDGVNLLPVATGTGTLDRDAIYFHYPHYAYHGENHMGSAVRAGRWKYIHHYDDDEHELYDLETDLGEQVDLCAAEPERAAALRGKLTAWLAATGAELPRRYADIPAGELPGSKRATFRPLLVPGSFDGWHTKPGGAWFWDGDVLVGESPKSEPRHGLLVSDARYRDFEVRFEFRAVAGDSGFYFRVDEVDGAVGVHGFQAEVDTTPETGGLYETGGRAWVVKPDATAMQDVYRPGEWTRMTLRARGGDVDVRVNGTETARLRGDPGRREGHLALQLHGGQDLHVEFRGLEIRELDD
ncbi:MAG: sulfatase-like hydrolase/transferase [Planctomycetes bacterium]|nr:sulfatase-like hydrolase/transferase [Planctomycetota bacterium]